jgi:CBS domain-containing protein
MNELPEIARFLAGLPGFDALTDVQVNSAASAIQIGYYRAGKDVLHIGDENKQLHIVRSGALELRNSDGDLVTRAAEGDCFGFPSLMNAAPVRHRSVAIEDALIYHIDGQVFANLRSANARFDTHFIRMLSDRLLTRPPAVKLHGAGGQAVSQLISRPPVTIEADASIQQAMQAFSRLQQPWSRNVSRLCSSWTRDIFAASSQTAISGRESLRPASPGTHLSGTSCR